MSTGTHVARIRYYRDGEKIHEENREIPTDPRLFPLGAEDFPWTEETWPEYAVIDYAAFGTAIYVPFNLADSVIRPVRPEDTPDVTAAPAPG